MLVGTTKGGTSTLYQWLRQHPDIALSRRKELHFWCRCPDPELRAASTLDEYLAHFQTAAPIVGEASPCYLYYADVASRLRTEFPDLRILVSLRDPVERFWSHYLMNEIYRPTGAAPEEIVERNVREGTTNALDDLLGMGYYAQQLEHFQSAFGRSRIHVTFLEQIAAAPDATLSGILSFLGLPSADVDTGIKDKVYVEPKGPVGKLTLRNPTIRRIGVAVVPPRARHYLRTRLLGTPDLKPRPSDMLVERLRQLYLDDTRALERLWGPLPWEWHRATA
jgi:hypothetical protein